uniref:Ribosomal protein L12 n=1 Tax=Cryptomonas sp. CCAC 1634B TaxID=2051848 RepID=A0A679CAG8_9CRYP|nr:ribosomal protein L12 [Cryptomonas sp. CCAC 1634B]
MTTKVIDIIEQLKTLTLLEAADLVQQIENTFKISAAGISAPVVVVPAASNNPPQEVDEKSEFDLLLEEVPTDKKITILKVVRTLTGLGLKEAKQLVESVPKNVKEGVSKEDAELAKKQLEEVGAKVKIL